MNRIIKFRVWDTLLGKMIKDQGWLSFDDPQYIFMQFTGLCDKNGKEIFEGDMLGWEDDDTLIQVKFGVYKDTEWFHQGFYGETERDIFSLVGTNENCIVVGNIFET